MKENIFKEMMEKVAKKEETRNKEVGKMSTGTKTKLMGIGTLVLFAGGVYLLYKLNEADTTYKRV